MKLLLQCFAAGTLLVLAGLVLVALMRKPIVVQRRGHEATLARLVASGTGLADLDRELGRPGRLVQGAELIRLRQQFFGADAVDMIRVHPRAIFYGIDMNTTALVFLDREGKARAFALGRQ